MKSLRSANTIISLLCLLVMFLVGSMAHQFIQNSRTEDNIIVLNNIIREQQSQLDQKQTYRDFQDFKLFAFETRYPIFTRVVNSLFQESKEQDVNPYLVLSVARIESDFNPKAKSSKDAYGIMQVHYPTWKNHYGLEKPEDLTVPEVNIKIGIEILKRYLNETKGDVERALYLYCNGYLDNPNSEYASKVLNTNYYLSKSEPNGKS